MKAWVLLLTLLAFAAPTASAQQPTAAVIQLDAGVVDSFILVSRDSGGDRPQEARFEVLYKDVSIERMTTLPSGVEPHFIESEIRWKPGADVTGWSFSQPTLHPLVIWSGQSGGGTFYVSHDSSTPVNTVEGELELRLFSRAENQTFTVVMPWGVRILPSPGSQVQLLPSDSEVVAPYGTTSFQVTVTNTDTYPGSFRVSTRILPGEGIDPADIPVQGVGIFYIEPRETRTITLSLVAPRAKFWYNDVPMLVYVDVQPTAGGSQLSVVKLLTVSGFYVGENLILLVAAASAQVALLIFLIAYAKRAYERRYLGRPIPPWQIPEEAANLERLKRENPRAHYVLRYFLMEEEYRSALLWFYAFKKISKRKLKAEIRAIELREKADELVSMPSERFDKASARVQRRFAKRMERAEGRTARRIEKLTALLERNHEKDFEEQHEKWGKKVAKLQKRHNKPYLKAKAKWDKETKRILEKWEKPFLKEKKKHAERLAASKEAYAKKVKKVDKDTWRAWREQMEDWEQESRLRKREAREPAPEPALMSAAAGPPELPAPFQEPPRPELPPEPRPQPIELPPEPQMSKPDLWTSPYAKKGRRIQRKGAQEIRALELKMAEKLNELRHEREKVGIKVEEKREKLIAESQSVATQSSGFMDRVLRRSADDVERRHQIAYLRGRTKERIQELEETEETAIERVRIQGQRLHADLEAKILVERGKTRMTDPAEGATHAERVASLVRELGELKLRNQADLAQAKSESKRRLAAGIEQLKAEEQTSIERELGRGAAPPSAEPART